ncbi:MAG TPA: hypothetical protein VEC19_19365 [Usitatibacter sp.]|nr:hypothetical protein [Usitatibacter sp.]
MSGYLTGRTPSFACQADPRFSYCLYVPKAHAAGRARARMLFAIHDTLRNNQALRDLFCDFAEESNTVVVAPLFPAGVGVADDLDNYKYLRCGDVRFDELVPQMAAEVGARWGVDGSRFSVFGFSGGAHFAHRFLYVEPARIEALVVASPGSVTLPTADFDWWPGLRDFDRIFGKPVDWESVKRVPTHFLVGADDTNPAGIVQSRDHPNWKEGATAAGGNRVERLRTLHAHLERLGARASFEELPGVGHELGPVVEAAISYLRALPPRPA